MEMPKGMTEQEVTDIIQRVARRLATNFCFGSHTKEDMRQQASLFAVQIMNKGLYDNSRPLENFLFYSVRNLLINFKRDNYKRTDCPCDLCYGKLPGDTAHDDGRYCKKFMTWQNRNNTKQNILSPLDIGNIADENEARTRYESTMAQDVEDSEILDIIDRELPIEFRSLYLRMREGMSVPKVKRDELRKVIDDILGGKLNEYTNVNSD